MAEIIEDTSKVIGENNHPALSLEGLGDNLVGLFFGLVRNKNEEALFGEMEKILEGKNREEIKNLFVVAFQTRWCRGGKGEKKLFYIMFSKLIEIYTEICFELLELIPQYGYWKDLRALYYYYTTKFGENPDLFKKINDILEKQLRLDIQELEKSEGVPKISLLAKYFAPKKCWAKKEKPEDKKKYDDVPVWSSESDSESETTCEIIVPERPPKEEKLPLRKVITIKSKIENRFFQELADRIYSPANKQSSSRSRNYAEMNMRKKLVALRRALDIPEVKMCANRWAEINFGKVTSLCLSRNTRAFLDEDKKGNLRHPDSIDRKDCRENLIKNLMKGVKGGQLNPNELVEKVFEKEVSIAVKAVVNSQWDSLVKNVQEQIQKRIEVTGSKNFDLTKCVIMSDVSGSMNGTPMMVSIGFGILVSQLAHESFRDMVMTFDTNPCFHSLKDLKTFSQKVESLKGASWGGSTNFEGAMRLIVDVIEKNRLKEDEIPQSLLVVSDMQFNEATHNTDYFSRGRNRDWGCAYDNIKNMFKKFGERMYGHGIEPPQIIFWNVRANTVGFPAEAGVPGVSMLSGYSPALLKFIFSGELVDEVEVVDENGEVTKVKVKLSPKETLAKILNESALDPVRVIVEKHL